MKRLLCLVAALFMALAGSQVPEYAQQYRQRLGGAVDELTAIVAEFDASAGASGLTREQALERYAASPDTFLVQRGTAMRAIFVRRDRLAAQLEALEAQAPWQTTYTLSSAFDTQVGRRAFEAYAPAVPTTVSGAFHAGLGFLIGYGVLWLVTTPIDRLLRRRRRHSKATHAR